jgi:hypothetical protein
VCAQVAVVLLVLAPPLPLQGLIDLLGVLAITAGAVFIAYALLSLGKVGAASTRPRLGGANVRAVLHRRPQIQLLLQRVQRDGQEGAPGGRGAA